MCGSEEANEADSESASRGVMDEVRQGFYFESNGSPLEEFEQMTDGV